jgi:hypothetical protein
MSTIFVSKAQIANIINDSIALGIFLKNTFDTEKCNYLMITDLNSEERHLIYKQMKYPFKFEKVKSNDKDDNEVSIRIYKVDKYKTLPPKKRKLIKEPELETVVESVPEPESKPEQVEESEEESESEYTLSDSDNNTEMYDDIKTMYNNQIEMYEKIVELENNTKKLVRRTNLILLSSIVGWTLLLTLDPVRLVVTHINN